MLMSAATKRRSGRTTRSSTVLAEKSFPHPCKDEPSTEAAVALQLPEMRRHGVQIPNTYVQADP